MSKENIPILDAEDTSKLIVIGDVHGLTKWRKVIDKHPDAFRYVFLGDYCDPYDASITDERVIDNFIDIINFKKLYPERVILLLGNHDMHYLASDTPKGSRYNLSLSMMLNDLFVGNKAFFQLAYVCNRLLFTHAGVLKSWLEEFSDNTQFIAEQINERSDDQALLQCGFLRGGLSLVGGPLWADLEEFTTDELLPGLVQIVGHNRVSTIQVKGSSIQSTGYVVFCDSLHKDNYLVVENPLDEEPLFYEATLSK